MEYVLVVRLDAIYARDLVLVLSVVRVIMLLLLQFVRLVRQGARPAPFHHRLAVLRVSQDIIKQVTAVWHALRLVRTALQLLYVNLASAGTTCRVAAVQVVKVIA